MASAMVDALRSLRPNAEWALEGDRIVWLDANSAEPTAQEIAAEIERQAPGREAAARERHRARAALAKGISADALVRALWLAVARGDDTAMKAMDDILRDLERKAGG